MFYKIDGSNGQIWLENGEIMCGSKNRVLTEEKDNQGFYQHVHSDPKYRIFFEHHPELRLYGEWLVPHTLKTYRDSAWRKFYVFDVMQLDSDNSERYLSYEEYVPVLEEFSIDYVPSICTIEYPSHDALIQLLQRTGNFLVADGKGLGEGIVVKRYGYINQFGRCTWGKIVRTEFKEKNEKVFGAPVLSAKFDVEYRIAEDFVTQALVEKEKAKIDNLPEGWSQRQIPRLLETVWNNLLTEETYNAVKKYKLPTINYKELRRQCDRRVKEALPMVFGV